MEFSPRGAPSTSHLLHHPRQRLEGSTALQGEPEEAVVGISTHLVHLSFELPELLKDLLLLFPHALVLLLALPEKSHESAPDGCD